MTSPRRAIAPLYLSVEPVYPAADHVERTNRSLRYLEKVRHKWQRRRTIVGIVVLAGERWWKKTVLKEMTLPQVLFCTRECTRCRA